MPNPNEYIIDIFKDINNKKIFYKNDIYGDMLSINLSEYENEINELHMAGIIKDLEKFIKELLGVYNKDNEKYLKLYLEMALYLKEDLFNAGIFLDGHNLGSIKYLNPSILQKISRNKEELNSLGIEVLIKDAEYFNIDEQLLDALFQNKDKISELISYLGIGKLELKHLSRTKLKRDYIDSQDIDFIKDLEKYRNITNEILNNTNNKKIPSKKENETLENIDTSNSNTSYLGEDFNPENIQNAFENKELFKELFGLILQEGEKISFKQFMQVSNLDSSIIKNYISLARGGFKIKCIQFLEGEEISDLKTKSALALKSIDEGLTFLDIVKSDEKQLERLVGNINNYKKLLSKIGEEGRFLLFYKASFTKSLKYLNTILESPNFEELLENSHIFSDIKPFNKEILNAVSLSVLLSNVSPSELTVIFKAFCNNLINGTALIDFFVLYGNDFKSIKLYLEQNSDNLVFYKVNKLYSDELIMLSREFGIEVSDEILALNKVQNIEFLHNEAINFEDNNFTSLFSIMDELIESKFWDGNIGEDNILLLSSILIHNGDIKEYIAKKYISPKLTGDDLEMEASKMDDNKYLVLLEQIEDFFHPENPNRLTNYKTIVRVYSGVIYKEYNNGISNTLNKSISYIGFYLKDISNFLINFAEKINDSYVLGYLLEKKVRLQDIERIINNYPRFLNRTLSEYHKTVIDYSLQTDNYDYIGQNMETINVLLDDRVILDLLGGENELLNTNNQIFGEKIKNIIGSDEKTTKLTQDQIQTAIRQILEYTGGFITYSIFKGVMIDNRDIDGLLEEFVEAKKEVLSGDEIKHLTDATYEAIFLAYKPSGRNISTIKSEIESKKVKDHTDHLDGIKRPKEGYDMEFYTLSHGLKDSQELNATILQTAQSVVKGKTSLDSITDINIKTFFSTPTNAFTKVIAGEEISFESNLQVLDIINYFYSRNTDFRINTYDDKKSFDYSQISSLSELFGVVAKDSFDTVIDNIIDSIDEEQVSSMLDKISKLKDKKLSQKFAEINSLDISPKQKLSKLFYWRFLLYTKQIRGYLKKEQSKYQAIKGHRTQLKAVMSKNVGSFYAKAGAQLCTSENTSMWDEKRHIHLNLIDHTKGEILGNIMLYFEEDRDYLVVRGFNPRDDVESSFDVKTMTKEMIRVVKQIAIDNGYIDENGDALVYTTPHDNSWYPLTNRTKIRKALENELQANEVKYLETYRKREAHFKAKSLTDYTTINTLVRL